MSKKDKEPLSILQEAEAIIHGSRRQEYGSVVESFAVIACLWTAWKGVEFSSRDVAMMMVLLKVARERAGYKRDSLVDICGYAALAHELQEVAA